jgi:transposase
MRFVLVKSEDTHGAAMVLRVRDLLIRQRTRAISVSCGMHAFGVTLGLVPRQHSIGGKQRLGATTRMGERSLRRLLIIGANSVIIKRQVRAASKPGTWLGRMLTRTPPMLMRVALSNDMLVRHWFKNNGECAHRLAPDGPRWRLQGSGRSEVRPL